MITTNKKQIKFSKNKKLNTALQTIFDDLQELGTDEVNCYKKEFPREKDFNLAQYGNLLCYYNDVYKFYNACGYKSTDKLSTEKIWDLYLRQVGFVARFYL